MSTIGIIAEYNPFHNGHLLQIQKLRKQEAHTKIVVVMSGSFTQRGLPTLTDKWTRAAEAVLGGANLVLELPISFVLRSAQQFAFGGISLLSRIKIIDELSFGCEYPDLKRLDSAARSTNTAAFHELLRADLEHGLSYAAAFANALAKISELTTEALKKPNTILAVEYLRQLNATAPEILPRPILREGASHHDERICGRVASASAIRSALERSFMRNTFYEEISSVIGSVVPACTLKDLYALQEIPDPDHLSPLISWLLRRRSFSDLCAIEGISEGLERRFRRISEEHLSVKELCRRVSSKRYPISRVQRTLIKMLLGMEKRHLEQFDSDGALYARILAFDSEGRKMLRAMKVHSVIPIITRTSSYLTSKKRQSDFALLSPVQKMLAFDTWGTELRNHCCLHPKSDMNDFQRSPVSIA